MKEWLKKSFSTEYRFTSIIILALVVILATFVLLYFRSGSIVVEHNIKQEDRSYYEAKQKNALDEYHACIDSSDHAYQTNWEAACRNEHTRQVNNCVNVGAPQSVCENHFPIKTDCELPSNQSNRVEAFRAQSRAECKETYDIETRRIEHE